MTTDTYRLLILTETQNDAEGWISLFRKGGHATRAHRVTSLDDLKEHLDEAQWDLLLGDDRHGDLSFADAAGISAKSGVPSVLLVEETSADTINAGFARGASDVVAIANTQHLLKVAAREITSARARNENRSLRTSYEEAMARAEQLMSGASEAIAFIADGMHIQANEAYAEAFGYESPEDLEATPIIDLVAPQDQDKFKAFLRHYSKGELENAELGFVARKTDGEEFNTYLQMVASSIEGEPCTQVILRSTAGGSSGGGGTGSLDAGTGLFHRHFLTDQISATMVQVANGLGPASLVLLSVDNSLMLHERLLVSGYDVLMRDLADMLREHCTSDDVAGRFGDGTIAIICQRRNPEAALAFVQKLQKTVEDHICEVKGQTVQYTVSAIVAAITGNDVDKLLDDLTLALIQAKKRGGRGEAELFVAASKAGKKPAAGAVTNSVIEEALEHDRFRMLFQPIISLRGDSLEHYEVFLRLINDQDKDVPPAEFLPLLTDSKLDRWLILEASKALSLHRAGGHDTRLIINLSGRALEDEALVPWIAVALKAANLPADSVVFQFAEGDITSRLKGAKDVTKALSDINCKVSLGQFGRSIDPIKTLKHVSVDYVKVDGSFTLDLQDNQGDPQLLKGLVSAINEAGKLSIVPCVENASVLATLWQVGVNYIQGQYLQPPSLKMDYEFTEIA
jgi:diguanylate cyclase (GGDEF)-like protein/PAS domain S-box-containing protein